MFSQSTPPFVHDQSGPTPFDASVDVNRILKSTHASDNKTQAHAHAAKSRGASIRSALLLLYFTRGDAPQSRKAWITRIENAFMSKTCIPPPSLYSMPAKRVRVVICLFSPISASLAFAFAEKAEGTEASVQGLISLPLSFLLFSLPC